MTPEAPTHPHPEAAPRPLAPPTLAACTIAKDEERDLPGWLANTLRFCDQIVVVVDTSTTDATRDLLRAAQAEHGDRVIWTERAMSEEGGFGEQRNVCIEHATADWLLHMDVDERVTPELARSVRRSIVGTDLNAFCYRRYNFFLHRPMNAGGWQGWNRPQLARRGTHRFKNRIHEAVVVEGGEAATGQVEGWMWHLIDADYVERVQKNAHYMQKSGDAILARGLTVRWYHLLFHPLWRGIRSYILKGGWRMGTRGFLFALYTFTSTFNWWAYAWDVQNRVERSALEQNLLAQWEGQPDLLPSRPHS